MSLVRATLLVLCLVMMAVAPSAAPAQSWPQRNVRLIVPLGPGSGADIGARLIADPLAARWGKPVVVEDRPGGDGLVAITAFLGAHDDHTLLFAPSSTFTAHPYEHDRLPYDPADLIPVARVSNPLLGFGAPTAMKIASLADLFARARAAPGKLNWATATGATEFMVVSFFKHAQLDIVKVPYRDTVGPATDLAEGRIALYLVSLAVLRPHVEAGKVKVVAVSNSVHIPGQPEIPTVAEAGFPALTFDGLTGLFAAREMAPDTRARIAADVGAVADADIAARLLATGQLLSPGGAAEFAASIEAQRATLAAIATEMGIKPAQKGR